QLQNLSAHVHRDLARQVAARDGGGHFCDVADLVREVATHRVDVIRQILPDAADALHVRLATQLSFGSYFARHARHFRRERVELVDHRVDGVLELQNLALDVGSDLARQVAVRDCSRDLGDIADLTCQVAGHRVDAVRQVLPRTGNTRYNSLS